MGKISSILGPLHGKVGNLVFRNRDGHTEIYSIDDVAARREPTINQKMVKTMFTMQMTYVSMHIQTINLVFSKGDCPTSRNAFIKVNYNGLKQALLGLCRDKVLNNRTVCPEDIEQAVQQYAQSHPHALVMAMREGYTPVHITGAWPESIVLEPLDPNLESVSVRNVDGSTTEVVNAEILRQTLSRDWMTEEELAAQGGNSSSTGNGGNTQGGSTSTNTGGGSQSSGTGSSSTPGGYDGD